ncbi:MAG: hypothetical protein IKT40_01525 [Bacilli bacterium]|nr:hypothetical protein [Bacilli bacterium]
MKNIDNMITESLHKTLKNFINESSSTSFDSCLERFDNKFNSYIEHQKILLNNRGSYYKTIRDLLVRYNSMILNLGIDYSLVKNVLSHNDTRIEVRYFINGSMNWDDDSFFDYEDMLYNRFNFDELNELGIELSLVDMREKGGECFIHLYFDIDTISEFEF